MGRNGGGARDMCHSRHLCALRVTSDTDCGFTVTGTEQSTKRIDKANHLPSSASEHWPAQTGEALEGILKANVFPPKSAQKGNRQLVHGRRASGLSSAQCRQSRGRQSAPTNRLGNCHWEAAAGSAAVRQGTQPSKGSSAGGGGGAVHWKGRTGWAGGWWGLVRRFRAATVGHIFGSSWGAVGERKGVAGSQATRGAHPRCTGVPRQQAETRWKCIFVRPRRGAH